MTYITTNIPQPGIVELLYYKGPTGKALSKLAHTLLHGPSPLSRGERELIAGYVSHLNDCEFCYESHCASANAHFGDGGGTTAFVKTDILQAPLTEKMKALLKVAARVQSGGKDLQPEHIETARKAGATDEEIHDTVLVAAAFCMYNRYVDGLRTHLPESKDDYVEMGKRMAGSGYKYPPLFLRKWVIRSMRKKALRNY
jgi:uncharacterized peroxidase-related enzyme